MREAALQKTGLRHLRFQRSPRVSSPRSKHQSSPHLGKFDRTHRRSRQGYPLQNAFQMHFGIRYLDQYAGIPDSVGNHHDLFSEHILYFIHISSQTVIINNRVFMFIPGLLSLIHYISSRPQVSFRYLHSRIDMRTTQSRIITDQTI